MVALTSSFLVAAGPPATRKQAVTDTYHGVEVSEDYRWLENWDDPEVRQWSDAQNVYARSILGVLPHMAEIRARLSAILSAQTVDYQSVHHAGGQLFAMKRQPPKQQSFLVVMKSAGEPQSERVLVDPNVQDDAGSTSIDWFVPSRDGRLVAVSLSSKGTESGDVHVFDVATGQRVHEIIPRVNGGTAGGDLAWAADGAGFFYTRYPRGEERPSEDMNFYQQVYFHKLGTPTEQDRYELGKDLPRIAEIQLQGDEAGGRILATVQNGDGGEFAHFLRSPDGSWKQFSTFADRTIQATFGPQDDLYLVSRDGAPRGQILRVPIAALGTTTPEVVVAQGNDTIVTDFMGPPTVLAAGGRLYVEYQLGGPSEIRVFDLKGRPQDKPQQLAVAAVSDLTRLDGEDILFRNTSFIDPPGWYQYNAEHNKTVKTPLASTSPVSFDDVKVVREFATSKDGTKVPINIMMPKNAKLDGSTPCVAYGYGGYGISMVPSFRPGRRVLFDQGVIFAIANLRGGAEYGEEWHLQGNLTKKQNVFDDFAAVCAYLVERGYTQPQRLAMMGGSNGGLLMGAALTQHPQMCKAVVSIVGIYDMLRVELSPNGAFNIPEFGTAKNPEHFKALYAYSPYHNVKDGTGYPAILFLTGANDPRVDPMQSRKMTARLQAASTSGAAVLLRTSSETGHGGGTPLSEEIDQWADIYAFLFDQLGVKYKEPAAGS
jgi:prolyl oligopeptidase